MPFAKWTFYPVVIDLKVFTLPKRQPHFFSMCYLQLLSDVLKRRPAMSFQIYWFPLLTVQLQMQDYSSLGL